MEELVFNFDESEAPKKKEVITYEPVEKGIRRKLKDGKSFPMRLLPILAGWKFMTKN